MQCVVSSAGSAGDFLPTLAMGAALRRRGHEVRFVANPFFESRVRNAGLEFIPAGEHSDLYEIIERNPDWGRPSNAKALLEAFVRPNAESTFHVIRALLRESRADVVVANNVSFGAIWAAAEQRIPSVLVHATPLIWMSSQAPTVFGDRLPPTWLARPMTGAMRALADWYLTRFLAPIGRKLAPSLEDTSYPAAHGMAALHLAAWSPAIRAPVPSDPPNSVLCGFVRASAFGGGQPGVPAAAEAFLGAGPPPVVVGLGSVYSLTAGALLTAFAEACRDHGLRCLIAGHPSGLTVPSNALAVRYAPYEEIFRRAAVVVGHGGAGTTGEILRSGKPALVLPFAYDQFAMSRAVEQQGVGLHVPVARRGRRQLAEFLERVLRDDAMCTRAAATGPKFAAERDGAEAGAEAVETLIHATPRGDVCPSR